MEALILTEGGARQGYGHVVRCLALSEAFAEQGIKPVLCINGDDVFDDMTQDINTRIIDWRKENGWLSQKISTSAFVLIDSYLAEPSDYQRITQHANLAVFIDDNNRLSYPEGIIVNFASHADEIYSRKDPKNDYLLGNAYVPLRRIFLTAAKKSPKTTNFPKKIFVSFGGGDPRNFTAQTLMLFRKGKYANLMKSVMVGDLKACDKLRQDYADASTDFLYKPSKKRLAEIMISSDIAISAAGMTLYELAFCQKPTIAVAVANNQEQGLQSLVKKGFVRSYHGWQDPDLFAAIEKSLDFHMNNYDLVLKENAALGRKFIDGLGAHRIANEIITRIERLA